MKAQGQQGVHVEEKFACNEVHEEALAFLDLLDEKAWHEMNGTREGEEFVHKFEYLSLCDQRFASMSDDAKKFLSQELIHLCLPHGSGDPIHAGRLLNELQYYLRYLADTGREGEASPLVSALDAVATSQEVSYINAQRSRRLREQFKQYEAKSEFKRRQEKLEGWQDKSLITIAPNITGTYTDQGIYVPSQPKHPEVIDKRLDYNDLLVLPVGNDARSVKHASDVWMDYHFLRNPEMFRLLPEHVQRSMNRLPLPEQAQMVQFMQERSVRDFEVFSDFVKQCGAKGARAFLSIELNDLLGEKIISIGSNLPPQLAMKLFETYGGIIDEIQVIERRLYEQYEGSTGHAVGLIEKIGEDIYRDATSLLEVYAWELQRTPGNKKEVLYERLQQQLETYRANAHLTAVSYKRMQEEYPDLALEEVAGLSIETVPGGEIPSHIAEQMLSIYMENYAPYPEEFREALRAKFRDCQDTNTRFHVVLDNEENVLSFMSFTDMGDGSVYFGSNNTNPWLKGKRVGGALMHAAVPQEGSTEWCGRIVCRANRFHSPTWIDSGSWVPVWKRWVACRCWPSSAQVTRLVSMPASFVRKMPLLLARFLRVHMYPQHPKMNRLSLHQETVVMCLPDYSYTMVCATRYSSVPLKLPRHSLAWCSTSTRTDTCASQRCSGRR